MSHDPRFVDTGRRRWTSWHHFEHPVHELLDVWNGQPERSTVEGYNATTRGFRDTVERALAGGETVRAKGAGWSYSAVGTTDGIVLNTRPLNFHFRLSADQVHADFAGDPKHLLVAQCGNSIADLNRVLEADGQSLRTSGAANGQTIVGAMSTGTHGAAIDVGAVQDTIVALHLVVSPERSVWLERASAPVVVDALPTAFGAELIRDDALFDAALVSFGSFGIIAGVVVEATDRFFLHAFRRSMPLDEGLWAAVDRLDFSAVALPRPSTERPHHFQLFIDPFSVDEGVFVVTMYKDPERPTDCRPSPVGQTRVGDGALEVMGVITDIAPAVTPALASFLVRQIYKPYEAVCGTHAEIFTDTGVRGKSASSAMGIPLGRVREALGLVLAQILEEPVPVTVALRYVRASAATLAFTHHPPQTCVLEIDGPRSQRVLGTYRRVWRVLEEAGIPYTFHWGKLNDLHLNPARLRRMYGDRVDDWLTARRTLLPTTALRHAFANSFLHGAGLAD
ncbi:MAG: FAD-binding protein [Acidobacteriota bacterium]